MCVLIVLSCAAENPKKGRQYIKRRSGLHFQQVKFLDNVSIGFGLPIFLAGERRIGLISVATSEIIQGWGRGRD